MGGSYLYYKSLNSKTVALQENLSKNINVPNNLITKEDDLFAVYMKCGELKKADSGPEKILPWLFLLLCYYIKLGNLKNPTEKYYYFYKDVAESFASSEISKEFEDSQKYQILVEIITGMDDKELVDSDEEKVQAIYRKAMFYYEEKLEKLNKQIEPPELSREELEQIIMEKHGKTEMVFGKEEKKNKFGFLKTYTHKLQYSLRAFLF